ncbi:MAG: MlaD family protein [Planctomycetota bacterium]
MISRLWLVTGLCLLVAVGLVVWNQRPAGPTIRIRFEQGHGLRPGNSLQHRGIEVGQVTAVDLDSDATGVVVRVMLDPQAKSLARDGSQFWIVRPRVSLARVTGLDTVVGARYIEVQPGPEGGPAKMDFEGLETPLALAEPDATEISIRFYEGHGLTLGDEVRHRGIVIGEVMAVELNPELSGVVVRVRLSASARSLARQGSQFWVERPTVNVTEIRGLETLVGGRFIAVQPAPEGTGPQFDFDGLDVPPPSEMPEGGLEIVLEARQRGGLGRGVPVLYRGFRIGHVSSVALATDAATVEARAWIEAPYRHLIREQTKFWMNSGVDVKVGLSGVELSAESLSSILIGGVSLATPPNAGAAVSGGKRFDCEAKPLAEWLQWAPQLPVGSNAIGGDVVLPLPVRVSLEWAERRFGFRRSHSRSGWALPLRDGRLLGLARLLSPVDSALDDRTTLACEGSSIELSTDAVTVSGDLAIVRGLKLPLVDGRRFDLRRTRRLSQPVDLLVATPGLTAQFGIAASRFQANADHWTIDASVPLSSEHDGAPVVSRESGQVLGFVSVEQTGSRVVLVPQSATRDGE